MIVSSYVAHLEGLVRLESIRAGRSFAFSLIQLYKFAVSSAILELPSLETKYLLGGMYVAASDFRRTDTVDLVNIIL